MDSLIQVSNNLANDKYAFSYYESVPLPRKTSFAMDYWGYYNGQENSSPLITGKNHTIVPNILPLITGNPLNYGGFDNSFYPLKGATRGASKNIAIATAGMLKSIQYPTKGKTVFTYEPHDYSNYKYYSLEEAPLYQVSVINDDVEVRAWGITPYPVTNVTQSTFRLTSGADVTLSGYSDFSGGALTIEGDSVPGGFTPLVYAISDPNPVGHLAEWNDKKIWLNPGKYTLKCDTPPSYTRSDDMYPEIWGKVIYGQRYYYQSDTSRSYHILGGLGGGLRIKTIVSYDENNKVVSSKKYSYVDESGNPSGKLLIPLQNFDLREKTVGVLVEDYGWYHNYTACTLYGSSYVSLSGYLTGNNVGYNRVVVESYNSSGVTKGKEISYYDNSPGSLYFGKIPFFSGANNGSLLKKIILNTDGDTLLTEKSNYGMLNGTDSSVTVNVYAEDLYEGPTDVCLGEGGDNPLAYSTRYHIYAYPTRNYYNALSSKETTHYFQNGKVKETTSYTYNPKNFCLQSTTETTSKGVKYTNIKYPVDYSGFIYNFMVSQNRISEPVEKVDSVNASTKFKVTTDYDIWNVNLLCAPKKISSTKGSNVQDDRILFGGYDKYGNLLEVQQSNNIKECYYYGYNSSMPVVKGVNIDTAILYPKIRQAIKSSGYSNIDDLLKAVKTFPNTAWNTFNSYLRSLCPDNLITTYTCDPLFGMTSSTDPNGLVTSYEYDLFGRLKLVRDKDGKILKTYEYHYKNQ